MVKIPKILLTNDFRSDIMFFVDAGLCKGSTTDSDSVCLGSNPSPATILSRTDIRYGYFFTNLKIDKKIQEFYIFSTYYLLTLKTTFAMIYEA